jgi:predicted P-loop ATPase/GTPase
MEPLGSIYSLFARRRDSMTKRILLIGMETFDSGKTTLAAQMATGLQNLGATVEYFKPISAHNYLERYAHTRQCLLEHKLYSYDAAKLRRTVHSSLDAYLMNPIHRLYVPAAESYRKASAQREMGTLALAGLDSVIALERISKPSGRRIQSTFLISRHLIESGELMIQREEIDSLTDDGKRIDITSLEQLQEFEKNAIEENLTESLELLEERADIVLIEAFNDSVWPWEGLTQVEHVIAVSQRTIAIHESERFRKAAFLMKRRTLPIREVTFGRIADLVEPLEKLSKEPKEFIDTESLINRLEIVI